MAKTYNPNNAAGTHTLGGAFTHLLDVSVPASGTDQITATNAGGTNSGYYEEAENTAITRTSTGSFTARMEITSAASNTTVAARVHRVNSSGSIQASSSYTAEQSSAATGTVNFPAITNPALGSWASTDRLALEFRVTNNNPHGGAVGPTFSTSISTTDLSTPFSQPITGTISEATTPAAETVAGAGVYPRAMAESGSAAEVVQGGADYNVASSESGAATSAESATTEYAVASSESGSATSAESASTEYNPSTTESASAADAPDGEVVIGAGQMVEAGAASEATDSARFTDAATTEAGSAADAPDGNRQVNAAMGETFRGS